MLDIRKPIAIAREKVNSTLLVDKCKVLPQLGGNSRIEHGMVIQDEPTLREYNGSTDIPCRFDSARAYREADYEDDEAVVFEYVLEVPIDLEIQPTDVIIDKLDRRYNIVKISDVSELYVSKSLLLLATDRFND